MNGLKKTLAGMIAGALGFAAQGCQMEDLQHLPGGGFSLMVERPFIAKKKLFNYSPAKEKGGKPSCTAYGNLEISGEEYVMIVSNECDKTLARVELSSMEGSGDCVYLANPERKKLELFSSEGMPSMDETSLYRHADELLKTFYDVQGLERMIEDYSR